jgi:hypothetical protein
VKCAQKYCYTVLCKAGFRGTATELDSGDFG